MLSLDNLCCSEVDFCVSRQGVGFRRVWCPPIAGPRSKEGVGPTPSLETKKSASQSQIPVKTISLTEPYPFVGDVAGRHMTEYYPLTGDAEIRLKRPSPY